MDIFVIFIKDADNIKPELLEQFRFKRISNPQKLKEHCFAYLMLDRILKDVYKIGSRELIFVNNKPYLKNRQKFFSISHSEEYTAIGFSDTECGIDIEKVKNRDYKSIAKRMNFVCNNLEEFYQCWTKYEAEYKLGKTSESFYQNIINDYILTAVSKNSQEEFNIYIQNGETFPNL